VDSSATNFLSIKQFERRARPASKRAVLFEVTETMKPYIITGSSLAGAILLAVTLSRLEGQSFTDVSGNVYRSEASRQ